MKRKKRTSITVETTRVLIVSAGQGRLHWCPKCAAEVNMLTLDETVAVARASAGDILREIEDQEIHSVQTPGSTVLICPNSLVKQLGRIEVKNESGKLFS